MSLKIIVDLDGTLKTDVDSKGDFQTQTIIVKSGNKSYTFAVRPYLHEFLSSCKSNGDLFLGTASGKGYAEKVLNAMNIRDYFDRVYTVEDFSKGIPYFDNCVMIDNDSEIGLIKLSKIAFSRKPPTRRDLWTIDTFTGLAADHTLLDLIGEIKSIEKG